jgi:Reverse transcriptase (RNA-dependent DNA polymerase)/Endonuclease-reverse transcriptase
MDLEGKRSAGCDENYQNFQEVVSCTSVAKSEESLISTCSTSTPINNSGCKLNSINYCSEELHVIYTNADCFTNKRADLVLFLNSLSIKPSIIAITEVNSKALKNKMQESEFNLDGYNIFSMHLGENKYRGILMYVDKSLQASEFEVTTNFEECLFVQIKENNKSTLLVGTLYRSPSSRVDNDGYLCELISHINTQHVGKKLLLGDFNYPKIDWKNWTIDGSIDSSSSEGNFLESLRYYLLLQHVDSPTRARGASNPSILDLVISNEDFVGDIKYLSPLGKSDHSVLQFTCEMVCLQQTKASKCNYSKGDYDGLRKFMDRDWDKEFVNYVGNIESAWTHFKTILDEGTAKFIPLITNGSWKRKSSWKQPISQELKKVIRKKHRLWTRFQETKNQTILKEFKHCSNIVRRESRKVLRMEQRTVAKSCKENPKKFWQYVKSKTSSAGGMGNIKYISTDGKEILLTDDSEKSFAFAEYFAKVYTIEPLNAFENLDQVRQINNMPNMQFYLNDIFEKLSKLKIDKSPGPDSIHPRILKEVAPQITGALKIIFDLSISTGELPEDWKRSIVSVIHKKGSKSNVSNYRPISLTCIICKVLESLMRDHLMMYFMQNNLFSPKQFGFIQGRSTSLQLINLVDQWTKSLEEGGQIDIIYTDFEKAFDKVPHKRLLSKLRSYGVSNAIISWIKGFLCYRKQQVKINGKLSNWMDVSSGIPQGSVLGPFLFVVYINDLPQLCETDSNLFLFADDTKMYKYIQEEVDCESLIKCCQNIYNWCNKWLMKLNIDKCKVLTITRSKTEINYKYGFDTVQSGFLELERVQSMKDLGVYFDSDLSFKEHIYEKINKAYQMIGIVSRNFKGIDKDSFKLIYKSLIRSQLEYASVIWNPYKKYLVDDLEKVQKRATKLVKGIRKFSYKERLVYLQLPTLKFRRIRGDMIEVYKIVTGKYDNSVTPAIPRSEIVKTRGNSMKLSTQRSRYDIRKYSFTVRIVSLWNSLPDDVVLADSVNSFKNKLDRHWMNEDMYYDYDINIMTGSCI